MAISGSAGDECRAFAVVPAPELLNVVLCDLAHIGNRAAPRLGGARGAARCARRRGPGRPHSSGYPGGLAVNGPRMNPGPLETLSEGRRSTTGGRRWAPR